MISSQVLISLLVLSCVFCCIQSVSAVTQNDFDDVRHFTCSSVREMENDTLSTCTFHKQQQQQNGGDHGSVICEAFLKVTNTTGLHMTFQFVIHENNVETNTSNDTIRCVAFRNIFAEYVDEDLEHIQNFDASEYLNIYQEAMAELHIEMPLQQTNPIPVGTVDLAKCKTGHK